MACEGGDGKSGRRVQKEPQLRSQRFCSVGGERIEANTNAPKSMAREPLD